VAAERAKEVACMIKANEEEVAQVRLVTVSLVTRLSLGGEKNVLMVLVVSETGFVARFDYDALLLRRLSLLVARSLSLLRPPTVHHSTSLWPFPWFTGRRPSSPTRLRLR
jgi:hypothetical protein